MLFLLGLGPAAGPRADALAWAFLASLFSEPLWLPIKSCLTFLDQTNWILGDVSRGEECTGGHHRCDVCDSVRVHCAYVWGLGVQGASGVPAAAPSPQPAQRHTGFPSLSFRCQFGLVTPGQGLPGLLQPRGSARTCGEAGGRMQEAGWPEPRFL